jgi:hypothetical protein
MLINIWIIIRQNEVIRRRANNLAHLAYQRGNGNFYDIRASSMLFSRALVRRPTMPLEVSQPTTGS